MTTHKSYKQSAVWAFATVVLILIALFVEPVWMKCVILFVSGFCFNEAFNWFINPVKYIRSKPVEMPKELEDYD